MNNKKIIIMLCALGLVIGALAGGYFYLERAEREKARQAQSNLNAHGYVNSRGEKVE